MLNYEFPPIGGGAANATHQMLKVFSKHKNIQIDLITSSTEKEFFLESFSDNIKIHKINVWKRNIHFWTMIEIMMWTLKAYRHTKKLVKMHKYDVCHCWFGWPPGFIGFLFRKKIPYIVGLRGSDVPGYNARLKLFDTLFLKRLSKIIWKSAKEVTVNSEKLRKLAANTSQKDIKTIHNGVDCEQFKPLVNKNNNLNNKFRIISIGRLIERKGYDHLIKALSKTNIKAELTLIGTGNQRRYLEHLATKLDVSIYFLGYQHHKKIAKLLQSSDIFVLPSLNEGMSNALLEAMACGLPVITTNTGGTKELVKDNGIIVSKKSSNGIANAIRFLAEDKQKLTKMGEQSRKIAETMSWEKTVQKYMDIYNKCIGQDEKHT